MTIIADTRYLFALYKSRDINHPAAAAFAFESASERMFSPDVAVTSDSEIELVPLLRSDNGQSRRMLSTAPAISK